jgi:hypothetical protein
MPNFYNSTFSNTISASGDAQANEVLEGKTFSSDNGVNLIGTMPNIGSVSRELLPGGSFIIPEGYHNGSGIISGKENTGTYTANSRNASLDMGETNTYRYVNTSSIPNSNSGIYTANSRSTSLDMGETNTYRYVNTSGIPNDNTGTYTFSSGNGDTVDLGVANTYRYVNASTVYNKGKIDFAPSYRYTWYEISLAAGAIAFGIIDNKNQSIIAVGGRPDTANSSGSLDASSTGITVSCGSSVGNRFLTFNRNISGFTRSTIRAGGSNSEFNHTSTPTIGELIAFNID